MARLFLDFSGFALQAGFRLGRDGFWLGGRLCQTWVDRFRSAFAVYHVYRHPLRENEFAGLVRQRDSRILEGPFKIGRASCRVRV